MKCGYNHVNRLFNVISRWIQSLHLSALTWGFLFNHTRIESWSTVPWPRRNPLCSFLIWGSKTGWRHLSRHTWHKLSQRGWAVWLPLWLEHTLRSSFLQMWIPAPFGHPSGTVPDLHVTLKRRVSQDSQTMSRALSISERISSTPGTLPLKSFLTTSDTSARDMGYASPKSSNSASSTEGVLVGFRSSSKCSFRRSIIFSVRVSSSPALLNTAWAKTCSPFLSRLTVCQNFHDAKRKSFSVASRKPTFGRNITFHGQIISYYELLLIVNSPFYCEVTTAAALKLLSFLLNNQQLVENTTLPVGESNPGSAREPGIVDLRSLNYYHSFSMVVLITTAVAYFWPQVGFWWRCLTPLDSSKETPLSPLSYTDLTASAAA